MKTSSPVFLSFLIFAFSANFLLSSAQNVSAPVLDTAGQELRRGVNYYILPAESGNRGGVTLQGNRGARCPFLVTQAPFEDDNGIPLRFSPINPNDRVIRVNTDLNIRFTSNPSNCPESTVWMLNASQSSQPPLFVTIGGVEGNPGPDTVANWFKIQRYEDAYQIQYCPSSSFCPPGVLCNLLCGNIGTVLNSGFSRLALNQETFKVKFQRA